MSIEEKVKNWLKNKHNLAFLAILALAIIIRLYYFFLTKNQPLWWDESEYMAGAKGYAGLVDFKMSSVRLPGFSLITSIFYILGINNEVILRFLLAFVPSILVIILAYLCIKEMYPDRKIALISTAILSVLFENLFFSSRFHTENPSMIFVLLSILVLFRGYLKNKNTWFITPKYSFILIIIFSIIAFFLRPGNIIFFPAIVLFIIFLNYKKIFSNKITIALAIILILAFSSILIFPDKVPKVGILAYFASQNPIDLHSFGVFYNFFQSFSSIPPVFFYMFLIGAFFIILDLFIKYDSIKNISKSPENLELNSDIFNTILILSVLMSFVLIIRPLGYEARWFFPLLTGLLVFTSKGIINFSVYLGNFIKNKKIIFPVIISILAIGCYTQAYHANEIIKIKLDSYLQVKEASIWIKENSVKTDVVLSRSYPQTAYYAERKTYNFGGINESDFEALVNRVHPKYMLESIFEPNPPTWGLNPLEKYSNILKPVKVWYADQEQTQAVLVVYEFTNI